MNASCLALLQQRFLHLIAQPQAVSVAARALAAADPAAVPLSAWLSASSEELAAARLEIYAHMYFSRLRDSLREDYPHCAALLGEASFDRVAAQYLIRHPSDNPSLRYHGRHFPTFIRTLIGSRAADVEFRADLADLCELEWARLDVFDAADIATLEAQQLAKLGPGAFAELTLRTVPALRTLEQRFSIDALWSACERAEALPAPLACSQTLLVWRRGFRVYHRRLFGAEAQALRTLQSGAQFSVLCELFMEDDSVERAAQRAAQCLQQWLSDQLLCRFVPAASAIVKTGSMPAW